MNLLSSLLESYSQDPCLVNAAAYADYLQDLPERNSQLYGKLIAANLAKSNTEQILAEMNLCFQPRFDNNGIIFRISVSEDNWYSHGKEIIGCFPTIKSINIKDKHPIQMGQMGWCWVKNRAHVQFQIRACFFNMFTKKQISFIHANHAVFPSMKLAKLALNNVAFFYMTR